MKRILKLFIFGLILLMTISITNAEEKCKDIFCNEFDYVCCCVNNDQSADKWGTINELEKYAPGGNGLPPSCPTGINIKECKALLSVQTGLTVFTGYPPCEEHEESAGGLRGFLGEDIRRWKCSNEKPITVNDGSNIEIPLYPGQMVYTWSWDTSANKITISNGYTYKYYLVRSGRAGSCEGVSLAGSVGCTFNSIDGPYRIYNEGTQEDVKSNFDLNENNCYRITSDADKRLCGTTCNTCETDSDCAAQYPKQFQFNGRNLGGYCQNGEIVLYGCEGTGQKVCTHFDDLNKNNIKDTNEKCYEETEKKDCALISRITTGIECCSSDDCRGTGDFYCNWVSDTSSKCEKKAQCTVDKDCGTSDKCDSIKKGILVPYCDTQKQCSEKTLKKVECCKDSDCQGGFYCTSDYNCEATPEGSVYDRNNQKKNLNVATGNAVKNTGGGSTIIGIIIGLVVLIAIGAALYLYKQGKNTKEDSEKSHKIKADKHCESCGSPLSHEDVFCVGCGKKV